MAEAHTALGRVLGDLNDARASGHLDQAVHYARRTGNRRVLADALHAQGYGQWCLDSSACADGRSSVEESLALMRANGDLIGMSSALLTLAFMAMSERNLTIARRHLEEAAEFDRQLDSLAGLGVDHFYLGLLAVELRDNEAAARHLAEALRVFRQTGNATDVAASLLGCALLASSRGEHLAATTLHGAADAAIERLDHTFDQPEAGKRDYDHQQLRAALGAPAFDHAYEQGHGLSLAAAVALASETVSTKVPLQ
jgi:hypothetical protein